MSWQPQARALLLGLCLGLCLTEFSEAALQEHMERLQSYGVRRTSFVRAGNLTNAGSEGAGVKTQPQERFSHSLWLRHTHPRLMSTPATHSETLSKHTMTLPLDHEDESNTATWDLVYWRNSASYVDGGPVFVMLDTTDYNNDWLREGHMADLARKFKADQFFIPTRFFGLEHGLPPTSDSSVDNLKYLTIEQVLLDVVNFLDELLAEGVIRKDQKVVLFGAGFSGAIATWARMGYGDIVDGVVASSPTLEAKYDTASYFPVVSEATNWYHRKDMDCEKFQRAAFLELDKSLSTAEGRRNFNRAFQPCTPFPEDKAVSDADRSQVLGLVAGLVADLVQDDMDGSVDEATKRPGGDKLYPYCFVLSQSTGDTLLAALGRIVTTTMYGHCLKTSFQGLVDALTPTQWTSEAAQLGLRQWLWLQCTELGQLPTTKSYTAFPYVLRLDMTFYKGLCDAVFGEGTSSNLVSTIQKFNKKYGGRNPMTSNTIFVKGDLDPWKDLGPPDDLSGDEVHVFRVKRASHAHDMFPRDNYDPPWMKKTRKAVATILERWLKAPKTVTA